MNTEEYYQCEARRLQATTTSLQSIISTLEGKIKTLEAYINEEGERNGVCTFDILQRVCGTCECEKGKK